MKYVVQFQLLTALALLPGPEEVPGERPAAAVGHVHALADGLAVLEVATVPMRKVFNRACHNDWQ